VYITFSILLLVTTMIVLIVISGLFASMQVNESFQKQMMALSGVISEHEKDTIISQWALMKS